MNRLTLSWDDARTPPRHQGRGNLSIKPLVLLVALVGVLSGCEGDPGQTLEQTHANFETFQKQSANAAERPYIVSYRLGADANGSLQGDVNSAWGKLPKSKRLALVKAIQQRWAAINSPKAISNSTVTLFSGGRDVAHVNYNQHSQWETLVK
ncbi:hypothetical protein IAD21_02444 [Abditibacteriota bacterium]|nr:hypothetical protein IAD21_02444 [Abditibacteriota bacterium]